MCRWLAYMGDSRPIEQYVYEGSRSLCEQAQQSHKAKLGMHGDGGGLGWYANSPKPGLYRSAGPAWADPNLRELTRVIESRIFFAHVRASTGAPNLNVNCHPFRDEQLLFLHNGQIGGFKQLRRQLSSLLTDTCFDALQGGTDSELLFQLMLNRGLWLDPHRVIAETIQEVEQLRKMQGITEAFRATLAVTDGESIWALRWSSDDYAPSLYVQREQTHTLIVSEPLDDDTSSWLEVPSNSLLHLAFTESGILMEQFERYIKPNPE